MHPEIGEARADPRLGLRDLVGMVDGDVVLAAAVDVEEVAQVFLRHRRALDVPAREALAPGAVPFHLPLLARRREFPEREVGRVALFPEVDALARLEPLHIEPGEVAIVLLLRGVEVDAVGGLVRVAVLLDVGDECDLLPDVVGRLAQNGGVFDVEPLHVGEECVGVELRDLPGGLAGPPGALFHLVLAGIGIGREMADIGDVHHVPDRIPVPFENAPQCVHEHERAEIADVLVVVDGRPARVDADLAAGMQGHERAQRARVVVVESERIGHGSFRLRIRSAWPSRSRPSRSRGRCRRRPLRGSRIRAFRTRGPPICCSCSR